MLLIRLLVFIWAWIATATALYADECKGVWTNCRNNYCPEIIKKPPDHPCALTHDLLLWHYLRQPNNKIHPERVVRFLKRHRKWPERDKIIQNTEINLLNSSSYSDVLRTEWFTQHPPQTLKGKIWFINFLQFHKQSSHAHKLINNIWSVAKFSPEDEKKFFKKFGREITDTAHYIRYIRLLWNSDIIGAKRLQLYRTLPKYHIGKHSLVQIIDNPKLLTPELIKAAQKQEDLPPIVLYYLARNCRKLQDYDNARIFIQKLITNHPKHSQKLAHIIKAKIWQEINLTARNLIARKRFEPTYDLLKNSLGFVHGPSLGEAQTLSGWLQLRFLNNPNLAIRHLKQSYTLANNKLNKARSAYWLARSYKELSATKSETKNLADHWYKQAAQYISTLYGQVAAQEMGINVQLPKVFNKNGVPDLVVEQERNIVNAIKTLWKYNENSMAEQFFNHIRYLSLRHKSVEELIKNAPNNVKNNFKASIGAELSLFNQVKIQDAYPEIPIKYENIVPKNLLYSIIRQESLFATNRVSRSGARGIMQLMPKTAQAVAKKINLQTNNQKLINDPHHNIKLGAHYLKELLEMFNYNLMLAVGAYNSGPTPILRWIENFGDPRDTQNGPEPLDWLEAVPYEETRRYIAKVLANIQIYNLQNRNKMINLLTGIKNINHI